MYRVIICDDESLCLEKAEAYIRDFFGKEEVSIASFEDGEALLSEEEVIKAGDILIMDINLGGMDGLECSKRAMEINPYLQVIFVTNYMDYVENSYDIPHLWYLNKSKQQEFIGRALEKAKTVIDEQNTQKIVVTMNGTNTAISCRDIIYFEQKGRKTSVITKNGTFGEYSKIDRFEELTAGGSFVRCHKSYLVNMYEVRTVGRQELEMLDGSLIPVSRSCRQNVQQFMLTKAAEK